eukprot:4622733-Heterocapsa_arctica.AAC.1
MPSGHHFGRPGKTIGAGRRRACRRHTRLGQADVLHSARSRRSEKGMDPGGNQHGWQGRPGQRQREARERTGGGRGR